MSTRRTWAPIAASAAGKVAEAAVDQTLDRVERLSLWAVEQAAVVQPDSALTRTLERGVRRIRPLTAPLPHAARRTTAAATYFAIRTTPEVIRAARRVAEETASFVGPGGHAWKG